MLHLTLSLLLFILLYKSGGCDLVMLSDPNFFNGLGMDIHVRTTIKTWWSYISSAVIRIGENTLEITGGEDSARYILNGGNEQEIVDGEGALGDFTVTFKRVNNHQSKIRIALGRQSDAVAFETFKSFIRVVS